MKPKKIFFSYNQIHKTVRKLAHEIQQSKYDFDIIVAIGTGGFIPARILKTFINKPIYTVGLKLYDNNNIPGFQPKKIQWIDEVEKKLTGKKILLVDEVDDSRTTLVYCVNELLTHNPREIAVAVLHNKQKEKNAQFPAEIKQYFYGEKLEDHWICYPWDAIDIDEHEKNTNQRS